MLPTNTRMKEFLDSIVDTPEGYRQAVITLEERYGGSAALLLTRQEAMMSLPELREGDFQVVEAMHTRLGTFLLEWRGIVGTPLSERESLAYYMALLGRVEHNYCRKFLEWLEQRGKAENLHAFHEWLAGELKRHRQTEIYGQFRTGTLGRGGGRHGPGLPRGAQGGEGMRPMRPHPTPQSALDRNFRDQRGFMLEQVTDSPEGETRAPEDRTGDADELAPPSASTTLVTASGRSSSAGPRPPCTLCQEDHGLGRCTKFQAMTPTERKTLLIKEGRCFLCFQRGHNVARCRFTFKCKQCNGKHHTLIHGADDTARRAFFTMEDEEEDFEAATESLGFGFLMRRPEETVTPPPPELRVSLRTLPVWVENPLTGEAALANAMLDDGCSSAALVSKGLAQKLKLKGRVKWASTEGVGGHVTRHQTLFTCVRVANATTKLGRVIPAQVMDRPAGTYEPVNWKESKKQYTHLRDLPLMAPIAGLGVEVMIGNQYATLTASLEEVVGGADEPVGRRTALGWTVVGPVWLPQPQPNTCAESCQMTQPAETLPHLVEGQLVAWEGEEARCVLAASEPTDKQLVRLLERMLEVEDAGEAVSLSPREEYIVKQARATLSHSQGAYQVGCTWAPGEGRPGLGRSHAEHRLRALEMGKMVATITRVGRILPPKMPQNCEDKERGAPPLCGCFSRSLCCRGLPDVHVCGSAVHGTPSVCQGARGAQGEEHHSPIGALGRRVGHQAETGRPSSLEGACGQDSALDGLDHRALLAQQ